MKIPREWTFDDTEVAEGFDGHVKEQLPWYGIATDAVAQIVRHYLPRRGLIYDIGAANGNVGRAIADTLSARDARLVAIEPSVELCHRYKGPGEVVSRAVEDVEVEPFDVAVSMLSLMFVAPSDVESVLENFLAMCRPGGAFVAVERTLPPHGYPGIITSRLTMAGKMSAGASPVEILEKELSLAGIQRPIDASLFTDCGAVEWFRFGDFAGYIIEASA